MNTTIPPSLFTPLLSVRECTFATRACNLVDTPPHRRALVTPSGHAVTPSPPFTLTPRHPLPHPHAVQLFGEWSPPRLAPEVPLALEAHKAFASTFSSATTGPSVVLEGTGKYWESIRTSGTSTTRTEHWGVLLPRRSRVSSVTLAWDSPTSCPGDIAVQALIGADTYVGAGGGLCVGSRHV
jgi:hypothetical protein